MAGGQGMPWGPTTNGNPSAVSLRTDPTQINVPGIDTEMQQVRTDAGAQQGSANNAAMAALQRAGVAGGGESGNALGNIAGETQAGTAKALAGLQQQKYQEQLGLMDALNNADLNKYNAESNNYLAEQSNRQAQMNGLGSAIFPLVYKGTSGYTGGSGGGGSSDSGGSGGGLAALASLFG